MKRDREQVSVEDTTTSCNIVKHTKTNNLSDHEYQSSTSLEKIPILMKWLQENGVEGLDDLSFQYSSYGSLGCFADKSFKKGELKTIIPILYQQ